MFSRCCIQSQDVNKPLKIIFLKTEIETKSKSVPKIIVYFIQDNKVTILTQFSSDLSALLVLVLFFSLSFRKSQAQMKKVIFLSQISHMTLLDL